MEWSVLPELVLRGKFSVTSKNSRSDKYKPASHTDFLKYTGDDYGRRGSYEMGLGESFKYEADFTLNYNKTFKGVHQVYVGLGYNFAEEKSENYSFFGEGIRMIIRTLSGLPLLIKKMARLMATRVFPDVRAVSLTLIILMTVAILLTHPVS